MLLPKEGYALVYVRTIYENAGFKANPLVSLHIPSQCELIACAGGDVFPTHG
jgi:hypothetical protein